VADLGGADLAGVLTDVLVPSPGGPLLCGQAFSGQRLCGEVAPADTWTSFALNLSGGTVLISTAITLRPTQLSLILTGGPVPLTLENTLRLADSPPLQLLGGKVHVNPVLMPEVCDDLALAALLCTDLDLAALACTDLDLAVLVREDLDPVVLVCEEVDLEELVCLEA
jgi:hypothetical protein